MSRIIVAVLVVAALLGTGFAFYSALSDVAQTSTERPLADDVATVRGRTVTCVELLPDSCSFDMQFAFDRWGDGLNAYLASDLGPWGRGVSDASAAKLGLQACNLSSIRGRPISSSNASRGPIIPTRTHRSCTRSGIRPGGFSVPQASRSIQSLPLGAMVELCM